METKAQGAIEYLLIIGAAVIIAVIVIALMMGLAGQGTEATEEAGVGNAFEQAQCQANCEYQSSEMTTAGESCDDRYSGAGLCVDFDVCSPNATPAGVCTATPLVNTTSTCYDLWPSECNN